MLLLRNPLQKVWTFVTEILELLFQTYPAGISPRSALWGHSSIWPCRPYK